MYDAFYHAYSSVHSSLEIKLNISCPFRIHIIHILIVLWFHSHIIFIVFIHSNHSNHRKINIWKFFFPSFVEICKRIGQIYKTKKNFIEIGDFIGGLFHHIPFHDNVHHTTTTLNAIFDFICSFLFHIHSQYSCFFIGIFDAYVNNNTNLLHKPLLLVRVKNLSCLSFTLLLYGNLVNAVIKILSAWVRFFFQQIKFFFLARMH